MCCYLKLVRPCLVEMHNGNDLMKSWAVVRLVHLHSHFLFSFVRGKVRTVTFEHVVVSHSVDDESQCY